MYFFGSAWLACSAALISLLYIGRLKFLGPILFRIVKLKASHWVIQFLIRSWPWSIQTWLLALAFGWYILVPLVNKYILQLPPGPLPWPVIGNILDMLEACPHKSFLQLRKTYGPVVFLRMGSRPCVVISSASLAQGILELEDKPDWLLHLTSSGHLLHTDKFFSSSVLTRNVEIRRQERLSLVKSIQAQISPGERKSAINIRQQLRQYAFASLCRSLFSNKFNDDIMRQICSILECNSSFHIDDAFPILRRVQIFPGRRRDLASKIQHLKASLLDEAEKSDCSIDSNEAPQLLDSLLLGQQYLVSTIEYAMAELILCPELLVKARNELDNVVGRDRPVDESDVPKLVFLQSVVKETLRLHPPAPLGLPRCSRKELTIAGYKLPSGCTALVNIYAINRDDEIWASPDAFKPERFAHSTIDASGNYAGFIPFSSGPRVCPGLHLALTEVSATLATLLQAFDWTAPRTLLDSCLAGLEQFKLGLASGSAISMDEDLLIGYACFKRSPLELLPASRLACY